LTEIASYKYSESEEVGLDQNSRGDPSQKKPSLLTVNVVRKDGSYRVYLVNTLQS